MQSQSLWFCPLTFGLVFRTSTILQEDPYTHYDLDNERQITALLVEAQFAAPSPADEFLQARVIAVCCLTAQLVSALVPLPILGDEDAPETVVNESLENELRRKSDEYVLLLTRFNLSGSDKLAFRAQQGLSIARARELPEKLDAAARLFAQARIVLLDLCPDPHEYQLVGQFFAELLHLLQIPYTRRCEYAQELLQISQERHLIWHTMKMNAFVQKIEG